MFNVILWLKKRRWNSIQHVETEDEILQSLLEPLLRGMGKKPLYLLVGSKGAGKTHFLYSSNAIKPLYKKDTVKNDFFEWYESDKVVYIKPAHRLIFQDESSIDACLWETFVSAIIYHRPRKPFNGCLFFVDFEFLIVNEEENVEFVLSTLCKRLEFITEQTSSALPVYLMMSKLDKLDGFKEYIQFSPLKSAVEFLSIQLKDTKGTIINYFNDSYADLITFMETSVLDVSSHSNTADERKVILTFPKQFELCQTAVRSVLETLSAINKGRYLLNIREVFFFSNHQGGRKYNLLAKSCSHYFDIPIIASGHYHLSESPYFTRFLMDFKILSESDFAGENKMYLKKIQKDSRLTIIACSVILTCAGFLILNTVRNNLLVLDKLVIAKENSENKGSNSGVYATRLLNTNKSIQPSFDAWFTGNEALSKEIATLNISYLNETTKLAYTVLLEKIQSQLIPMIEEGYRLGLVMYQGDKEKSLSLLKGYIMLNDPSKRDLPFLYQQTKVVLDNQKIDQNVSKDSMDLIQAYFSTQFPPVVINMDLVRATRRQLLSNSNVDLVYESLLDLAKETDVGFLNIPRAVGFDFSNLFVDKKESANLDISKVYTDAGFSTFFRPNVDLMSKDVISDNWVLGLSKNTVPTESEQDAFKDMVRKKYTDDYINHWRNALGELKIKRYQSIGDLTNGIDLISGPSSPMSTVLKLLYSNTHFTPIEIPVKEKTLLTNKVDVAGIVDIAQMAAEKIIKPDYLLMVRVEQAFRLLNRLLINETPTSPTPWDEIIAALSQVRTYIKDITDAPNIQEAALIAAKTRMSSTEADPIVRLKQIAQDSPEPVRTWLLNIVDQTWSVIISEGAHGIQTKWYSEVYSKFKDIGLNKYPFNNREKSEISLEGFELLFSNGGLLDLFIKENFAPFFDTVLWKAKRVDGEVMVLSPELLVQLKNYNVIRDTFINKSTNKFHVPFSIKVIDLDSSAIRASIKIAEKTINYYQGPSQVNALEWPPQEGDNNITITIQDVTNEGKQHVLSEDGQWALFRLIGKSIITKSTDGTFTSDITVSGRVLRVLITPLSPNNPFTLRALGNFTLPENIN